MTKIWGRIMIQIGGNLTRRFGGSEVFGSTAASEGGIRGARGVSRGNGRLCLGIRDLQRFPTVLENGFTGVGPLSGVSSRYADRVGQPKIF